LCIRGVGVMRSHLDLVLRGHVEDRSSERCLAATWAQPRYTVEKM
jgi:hypothetical protein